MIALATSLLLAAVRELDQTAFNEIEESPLPAFLKLDPPNCAACHLFNPFWASWAEAADNMGLEGRVWRVDCGVHQAVCKDRQVAHNGDESNFASAPDASFVGFFDVWTGSVWRRYDGVKDAQTLANWLGSGAWQRDDGPHLTTPEQNWRDPWVQSFAKHAARSSHTSWETMRQPWADWAPCDADDAFERLCAPIAPQCERDGDIGRGHGQGFGNALYSLSVMAAGAFADNCTVRYKDDGEKNNFRLGAHMLNPTPSVPTQHTAKRKLQPGPCTLHAITRIRPGSDAAARVARLRDGRGDLPIVSVHLRTGWADTLALHPEWGELECGALAAKPEYEPFDATMWVVSHEDEFGAGRVNLSTLLLRTADAADGAFGARRWRLYVASDAPIVKERVAAFLKDRARETLSIDGRVGHTNAAEHEGDDALTHDLGASAVGDFVMLRDSAMLVGYLSNFPKRAGQAAVCPQRWIELRSRERKDDVREHVIEMDQLLTGKVGGTQGLPPGMQATPPRPLALHVPPRHPCLDADEPTRACACLYKLALDPAPGPELSYEGTPEKSEL